MLTASRTPLGGLRTSLAAVYAWDPSERRQAQSKARDPYAVMVQDFRKSLATFLPAYIIQHCQKLST